MNGGELAVVAYSYDAVGQLSGKTYGTGTHAIHETMEYNIQGWLTAKNSELFDMSLDYYNKWGHIDDVSPSYTGNITSWQWQHKKVDGTADADERAYRYRYDDLSRLTAAEPFSSTSSLHTDWSTEKGITYDRNGNILTLTRTGSSGAVSQSYSFEYVGNQRKKTMNGSEVYTYDANGNMTEDALTGFGISYNLLNLPEDLQDHWGSGEISHRYSYLADGTKKTVGDYENYGYRYVGSLVYHWRYDAIDSFESTSFGGGRIVGTDSGSEVHYFLTDHQVQADLNQLAADNPVLAARIETLENSDHVHTIERSVHHNGNTPESAENDKNGIPTGSTTAYNPNLESTPSAGERPARAGLAHELLGHGYDSDQGITNHQKTSNGIPMSEVNAVNTENLVRKASNTPIRTTYDDKPIPHKLLQDPQQ